jgi:hypothetical protein
LRRAWQVAGAVREILFCFCLELEHGKLSEENENK